MSGGGGEKNKAATPAAASTGALPDYLGGGSPVTFPQAMPGQLEAIAAQLSAGFGQTPAAIMTEMDKLYAPMPVGQAPKPAVTPKPTSPATSHGRTDHGSVGAPSRSRSINYGR